VTSHVDDAEAFGNARLRDVSILSYYYFIIFVFDYYRRLVSCVYSRIGNLVRTCEIFSQVRLCPLLSLACIKFFIILSLKIKAMLFKFRS